MRSRLKERLEHIIQKYEKEADNEEMSIEYMPLNNKFVKYEPELMKKPKYLKVRTYQLQYTPSMDRHD